MYSLPIREANFFAGNCESLRSYLEIKGVFLPSKKSNASRSFKWFLEMA